MSFNKLSAGKKVMLKKETELSRKIKKLRYQLGLTQEQFAAVVGVTYSTVNRWENSKGNPSPLAMKQIGALQKQSKSGLS